MWLLDLWPLFLMAVFATGAILWVVGGIAWRYQDAVDMQIKTQDRWHRADMENWASKLRQANPNIDVPPVPNGGAGPSK